MLDTTSKIKQAFQEPVNSSRFVQVENLWYFATRESGVLGPYQSYTGAVEALRIHLSNVDNGNCAIPQNSAIEVEELDANNLVFWKH